MRDTKIAIIGLGYVGLPLAVEFAKKYQVVGFDINAKRIKELRDNNDFTLETSSEELEGVNVSSIENLKSSKTGLWLTDNLSDIEFANFYVVTVPTPVDKSNRPDLTPLYKASETVGKVLSKDDVVVYESTVFPGATEDECIPILEKVSGLTFNKDFYAGYSPERINPGDKLHTVTKILKVTSGSTPEIAKYIDDVYKTIIVAGTHLAPSIKVAEAAKVIENSQRDINIAFVNELSKIFRLMNIDTLEVLEAAGTKWNFLPFRPGLVGGHCIGVDPYYLAQKAMELGYNPEIILAGRRLNDSMGPFVAQESVKMMIKKGIPIKGANVLVLGITFKEDCPDIRNSRAIDIVRELESFEVNIDVYDPWATAEEVKHEYGIDLICSGSDITKKYDGVVIAVSHKEFKVLNLDNFCAEDHIIFDVKATLPKEKSHSRL
ncbi:nucleotide sugar dehydrogenase [Aureibaculum sp. 2210JD6-5]|uniref:nucleotide sugar dehydrogenase n=1 Tax=Aureibaculum sp. 2210JD6-5 TaxID=3103957 RepID=UPI002AACDDDB|nr:nucleotide sugar dehydrogenase [Aureibaculum sp. 2210JD6-5]MDY7394211.1 nucleotide sugar dehydrogenase [Aureibaculum sp. 2210JD6-5]